MLWRDLVFEQDINDKNILAFFNQYSQFSSDKNQIVEDIAQWSSDNPPVTAIKYHVSGDFRLLLTICLPENPKDEFEFIQNFSYYLDTRILISNDNTANLGAFWLFSPTEKKPFSVLLDETKLEDNIYTVTSYL